MGQPPTLSQGTRQSAGERNNQRKRRPQHAHPQIYVSLTLVPSSSLEMRRPAPLTHAQNRQFSNNSSTGNGERREKQRTDFVNWQSCGQAEATEHNRGAPANSSHTPTSIFINPHSSAPLRAATVLEYGGGNGKRLAMFTLQLAGRVGVEWSERERSERRSGRGDGEV